MGLLAGALTTVTPATVTPATVTPATVTLATVRLAGPTGSAVSAAVLAATLSAACAHAAWNSIAHAIPDKVASFTLVNLGALACAIPLVVLAPPPAVRCWGYLAASVVLHVMYNGLLMLSYRLGDFSQTYPLARGTSPLVVMLLAAVFAGEMPGPGQFAGVALICGGLGSLVLAGRRAGSYDRRAVLAALATGLTIAAYTMVDGVGVRLSGSTFGYTGWLMLTESSVVPIVALACQRGRLLAALRPVWPVGLLGGALSVLAYGLVLWAQTRGALATVAALRESSIILAAVIGSVVFHERFGWPRILAAGLVTLGIVVLYLA
jgi:drug/metabolite transporter (DMT)-like permease